MSLNMNNFTNNVANGRLLITEHYDQQINALDVYLKDLTEKPETASTDADGKEIAFVTADVKQYASAFRVKAIEEIKRVQQENLKHCETLWNTTETDVGLKFGIRLKHSESIWDKTHKSSVSRMDLIKRELFSKIFCFVVNLKDVKAQFKLKIDFILLVIDFYLNPAQVAFLEYENNI